MPLRLPTPRPAVFAHRGAHGPERPENSLSTIERALELAVAGVEIDVCSLRDGTLVVAHDGWVACAGRRVPFSELLPEEVDRVSRGPVLRAEPVLELFESRDTMLCLDWKGVGDIALVGKLARRHGLTSRTIVSSERPAAVAALKVQHPRLGAGLSLGVLARPPWETDGVAGAIVGAAEACGADAVMLQHRLGDDAVLAAARARGVAVFLWTAEDLATHASLLERSPDGVMSDVVEACHPSEAGSLSHVLRAPRRAFRDG